MIQLSSISNSMSKIAVVTASFLDSSRPRKGTFCSSLLS